MMWGPERISASCMHSGSDTRISLGVRIELNEEYAMVEICTGPSEAVVSEPRKVSVPTSRKSVGMTASRTNSANAGRASAAAKSLLSKTFSTIRQRLSVVMVPAHSACQPAS